MQRIPSEIYAEILRQVISTSFQFFVSMPILDAREQMILLFHLLIYQLDFDLTTRVAGIPLLS